MGDREIIHRSRWAITERCGQLVKKFYLFDNPLKIEKEVKLLRWDSHRDVRLYYDLLRMQWVSEMEQIFLQPLFGKNDDCTVADLRCVFSRWDSDQQYLAMVDDDWDTITKPYLITLLRQYLSEDAKAVAYLTQTSGEHFIHGDFTLSNVQRDLCGQVVVFDFENAGTGPMAWDETTMVYSLIEEKQYDRARKLLDAFQCPREMLACIAGIRLALCRRKSLDETERTAAYSYVLKHFGDCSENCLTSGEK